MKQAVRPAPPAWLGAVLGTLGSLLFHGGLDLLVIHFGSMPDLGIELTLPSEVEFGVTEGGTGAATPELPAPPEPPPREAEPPAPAAGASAASADAGVDGSDAA